MNFNEFTSLMKRKKGTIFSLTLLIVVLIMLISLLGGLKYSARSKVLVFQDNASLNDAYTVSRSNEYLSSLLSQVVYSSSFFNMVIENPQYKIDSNYFSGGYADRLKKWRKTVATKSVNDTGIIEVNVFHEVPDQARMISLAVNDVLINKNSNYHGGQGVTVNVLDQPLVSDYPDKPNLFFNFIFSLFLGLFLAIMYSYIYPEEVYDFCLWPKKKRKNKNRKESKSNRETNNRKSIPVSIETDYTPRPERVDTDNTVNSEITEENEYRPQGDISGILN